MSDIRNYIDRLRYIDEHLTDNTSLKERGSLASDILGVADELQRAAVSELENLILYKQQVLESNQYTELFTYYKEKEFWNTDVIIRLIELQKLGKLQTLNAFCENNMKFLVLSLVEAIKSDLCRYLYETPIDEGIKSLNYYFSVILDNCPDADKESTNAIIDEMKQECADAYADRIAENKKAEYDEFREEHCYDSYIEQCDEVLKFVPDNKRALSLKNYFLEQKIEDMENGLDEE